MTISEKVVATALLVAFLIAACISYNSGIKIVHAYEKLNHCDGVKTAPLYIKCSSDSFLLDSVWQMSIGDIVEVKLCE